MGVETDVVELMMCSVAAFANHAHSLCGLSCRIANIFFRGIFDMYFGTCVAARARNVRLRMGQFT